LVLGADKFSKVAPVLQALIDEVLPHVDVLALLVKDRILAESQCGHAIYLQLHGGRFLPFEVTEQPCWLDGLSCRSGCRNVLFFTRRQSNDPLLHR
jgi:hypothetical protein